MFVAALPLRLGKNRKRGNDDPSQQHQLTSEDTIKALSKEKTVLGLLRALTQIACEEAALCKGVLVVLTEHQRSLGSVELSKNTLSGVEVAVKEHGRKKKQLEQGNHNAANDEERPSAGSSKMRVLPALESSQPARRDDSKETLQSGVSPLMLDIVEACTSPSRTSVRQSRPSNSGRRSKARLSQQTSQQTCWEEATKRPFFPAAYHGSLLKRVFLLFEGSDPSWLSKVVEFFVVSTILVSTASFILESLPQLRERPAECAALLSAGLPLTVRACEPQPLAVFYPIEAVCIMVFTVDYAIRILLAHTARNEDATWLWSTILYMRQPLCIVDLLAIAPFYIELVVSTQVGISGILRLARTLRLLKLFKRIPMISIYVEVFTMSGQPLGILLFFGVILVTVFGALIYYAEGQTYSVDTKFVSDPAFRTGVYARPSQDGSQIVVSPFHSIPYSLWWVCVTLATVGYGDYVPTSAFGKTIGVATFYCGIMFLALPISILGQNFASVYQEYLAIDNMSTSPHRIAPGTQSRSSPAEGIFPSGGFRRQLFLLLEDPASSCSSKVLSIIALFMILVSTISFIIESMPMFKETPKECMVHNPAVEACEPVSWPIFSTVEVVCVAYFTVDYVVRIACVHTAHPTEIGLRRGMNDTALRQTFLYFKQPLNLIDLFAIVPFYVELCGGGGGGASVLRVLRLIRVFRVLRAPKLKSCAEMFIAVGADALPALALLVGMSLLACIFSSSCIYFAEGTNYSVHPDFLKEFPMGAYVRPTADGFKTEVSPYSSIPYAFWWFFTTSTTVGYGDDVPTTTAGRIIAVFVFMMGVVLLAMPITIVGGAFAKRYEDWVASISHPPLEDDVADRAEIAPDAALRSKREEDVEQSKLDPGPQDGTDWQEEGQWWESSPPPDLYLETSDTDFQV